MRKIVPKLFTTAAKWIWDDSDRFGVNYSLRAKRTFLLSAKDYQVVVQSGSASLAITADAFYQVFLNGVSIGHGPAKSPAGERHVDEYGIASWLRPGENELQFLVFSIGAGTATYCVGQAGLIFELAMGNQRIASDPQTQVQINESWSRGTVRRWLLPHLEDIKSCMNDGAWKPALVVGNTIALTPRPVPLPSRRPQVPKRWIASDVIRFPEFTASLRIKPYLVDETERRCCNVYRMPAVLIADLVSEWAQSVLWLRAPGQVDWFLNGKKVASSSGWSRGDGFQTDKVLKLKRGSNQLLGLHQPNHFEEVHLAIRAPFPLSLRNPFGKGGFQVVPLQPDWLQDCETLPNEMTRWLASVEMPEMNPSDTLLDGNLQDLAVNAEVVPGVPCGVRQVGATMIFSEPPAGHSVRVILDLGAVCCGWLSFRTSGKRGCRFLFSFFEALEYRPPLAINWPGAVNNALRYELRDGVQTFESFFPYGVRYIAVHYEGAFPAELIDLAILSANCGQLPQGSFLSSDVMLNRIYSLCEQTVISATDDTLTDCPTYEMVNWNFDNRLGAMADLVTGRNLAVVRNTIEQFTRDNRYPGLVRCHYPSAWETRIPSFSYHWMVFCQEFYDHTHDREFLDAVLPQMERALEEMAGMADARGFLLWQEAETPWHLIDWNAGRDDDHPVVSAEQGLACDAIRAAMTLLRARGKTCWTKNLQRWEDLALGVRTAVQRGLWMPECDAYADSLHADGTLSPVSSQASNAILACARFGSGAWRRRMARRCIDADSSLLPCDSPMGLFYVLELLDQCGEVNGLFGIILERWGQMVLAGDETAWEQFAEFAGERFPTRSRCHPFATYVLKYFVKYLLGIRFVDLDRAEIRFKPQPPEWLQECHGSIPTVCGPIHTGWKRKGRKLVTSIEIPFSLSSKS